METLALAIEVADLASEASGQQQALDVKREAERLLKDHPEAELTVDQIAEALEEEQAADK